MRNDDSRATDGQRAGVPAPFGWVSARNGNYFTRSERIAKRIGGLIPVYATPPAGDAGRLEGVNKVERESDFSVRLTFDSCRQASAFDRAAMAAMAASKGK